MGRWQGKAVALMLITLAPGVQAASPVVYRCPGPPVLYTDGLTALEAQTRGCRVIETPPVTVVPAVKPKPTAAAAPSATTTPRPAESRVNASDQRARDAEARRILEGELRSGEEKLAALKTEFNNGEPERRGDERNYQRYLDRVADLKTQIQRRESDVAAIRREIGKLGP